MQLKVGEIVEGKIVSIKEYGVFVDLGENTSGMVHISEIARDYVNDINDFVKLGDTVKMKVLTFDENGKISLSIKKATQPPKKNFKKPNDGFANRNKRENSFSFSPKSNESLSFEEMMNKFKASSDEKFSDLKRKNPETRRSKRGANSR